MFTKLKKFQINQIDVNSTLYLMKLIIKFKKIGIVHIKRGNFKK